MIAQTPPLREFKAWAVERFGARLVAMKLFGSRARGDAHEDSDWDVLVVVEDLTGAEAREIAFFCGDLMTKYDVLVSALALSRDRHEELLGRERRIALEIEREGMPL